MPGAGHTAERHLALYGFGLEGLSFARLAEAHTDAVAILHEAGREASARSLYGVWASEGRAPLLLLEGRAGQLRLRGSKFFCSGAGLVDRALMTAHRENERVLVDVALNSPGIEIATGDWASAAFVETSTASLHFMDVSLPRDALIQGPEWYLDRIGFWHGAIGPSACWAGGAGGLVRAAAKLDRKDAHSRAQLGALYANEWAARCFLMEAGRQIDRGVGESAHEARARALEVRHLIERLCVDTLDRFGRATGPQLLAFDADIAQRHVELALYIRQCHAERDLEAIAAAVRSAGDGCGG